MSKPPDEEEDQIFSGKSLRADGSVHPAKPIPLTNEIPVLHEDSLIHDPAYEPTVISPSRAPVPVRRTERVELVERPPPPMASDFVPPRPDEPVHYRSPDIDWQRWGLRLLLLAVVAGGGWAIATGKLSVKRLDSIRVGGEKAKEQPEKHVATPAPTLLILSDPPGATVLVGGTEVGVTPWAGDNVWPREPLRIEVRKAGYQPWHGLTMGGKQETLEATLRRH